MFSCGNPQLHHRCHLRQFRMIPAISLNIFSVIVKRLCDICYLTVLEELKKYLREDKRILLIAEIEQVFRKLHTVNKERLRVERRSMNHGVIDSCLFLW